MKKPTKKDRVEKYLNDWVNTKNFKVDDLDKMTFYDLMNNPELKGIGKTTLSGALNSLKKEYGLKGEKAALKNTKKEKVETYLSELMNTEEFTADDLMNLTVYDLLGNAELEGIGKTTLSGGISDFKKKYFRNKNNDEKKKTHVETDKDATQNDLENKKSDQASDDDDDLQLFESAFINAIEEENGEPQIKKKEFSTTQKKYEIKLQNTEVNILKEMIDEYKNNKSKFSKKDNLELTELKQALKYFGIDYKKIIKRYRKYTENDD